MSIELLLLGKKSEGVGCKNFLPVLSIGDNKFESLTVDKFLPNKTGIDDDHK